MLTLALTLHSQTGNQGLALALPKAEWLGLVSNFTRMPPLERTRVGHSIQAATAQNPFPVDGSPLTPAQQQVCDTFISDCMLLAALAEATSARVLQGTTVASYQLQHGNAVKAQLN